MKNPNTKIIIMAIIVATLMFSLFAEMALVGGTMDSTGKKVPTDEGTLYGHFTKHLGVKDLNEFKGTFEDRKTLFEFFVEEEYRGNAEQNMKLLKLLKLNDINTPNKWDAAVKTAKAAETQEAQPPAPTDGTPPKPETPPEETKKMPEEKKTFEGKLGEYAAEIFLALPVGRSIVAFTGMFGWWAPARNKTKWSPIEGTWLTRMRQIAILFADIYSMFYTGFLIHGSGKPLPEDRPLLGTKYCELCNWDEYTVCTETRCRMLGQCVPKAVPDQRGFLCLPAVCEEGYPKITQLNVSFHIDEKTINKSDSTTKCEANAPSGAACINAGEVSHDVAYARIYIKTENYAECRYIVNKKNVSFNESTPIANDEYMPKERTFDVDLTRLEPGREHYIIIKCSSTCNEHPQSYDWNFIKFKLGEKPDWIPPSIVMVEPDDKLEFISDALKQLTIKVWLDENGGCRYSTKREGLSKNWTDAADETCKEANESAGINGTMCVWGTKQGQQGEKWYNFIIASGCTPNQQCRYKDVMGQVHYLNKSTCTVCNLTINLSDEFADIYNWTKMGEDVSKFAETCKGEQAEVTPGCEEFTTYVLNKGIDVTQIKQMGVNKLFSLNFRCEDLKGNIMPPEETYEYRLFTFPPYNITILEPEPGFTTYHKSVDLVVVTDRPTKCRYVYGKQSLALLTKDFSKMIDIDETLSTEHKGKIENLTRGSYNLSVKCRDIGNMEMSANTSFIITSASRPKIIRMYAEPERNMLKIETDIESHCFYSVDENIKCGFRKADAQSLVSTDKFHHEAQLVREWTYYLKCQDIWEDNPFPKASRGSEANCTIIRPFELEAG